MNHFSNGTTSLFFELAGTVLSDWKIEPKTFHDRFACLVSVGDMGDQKFFNLRKVLDACWIMLVYVGFAEDQTW